MSTWYGYVCLSHEPPLEQDRVFHGHKGEEFLIWNLKRRRGQVQETSNYHDQNGTANAWLDEHPDCNVGVKDGYGETVYTYLKAPKAAPPEISLPAVTKATEIEPGKQYMLTMSGHLTDEQAEKLHGILKGRFPTNTFVLASPNIAVVPVVQLAQGGPVRKGVYSVKEAGEEFIPYGENGPEPMVPRVAQAQPHAVRQNDLVEALRAVAERFPGHTELNYALRLLAQKLAEL